MNSLMMFESSTLEQTRNVEATRIDEIETSQPGFEAKFGNGTMMARSVQSNEGSSHNFNSRPQFCPANHNAFYAAHTGNHYVASPESVADQAWYADSGVSSHVTHDVNQLYNKSSYAGYSRLTSPGNS
ncbi:hypothetical protein Scep_021414 [Stephania cephalantha]|uniref:Uncharacterized protein n=1 Tax=Stephania cephalantha TaxID=152367 RepID=A0AAP0F609_9MAGN